MESGRPFTVRKEEDDACGYWSVLQYLANGTKDQEMILKPVNYFFFNSNNSCGGVEQELPLRHKLRKACGNVRLSGFVQLRSLTCRFDQGWEGWRNLTEV